VNGLQTAYARGFAAGLRLAEYRDPIPAPRSYSPALAGALGLAAALATIALIFVGVL
jgi:hypothetical protein